MVSFLSPEATAVRLYVIIHMDGCLTCEHYSSYNIVSAINYIQQLLRMDYVQKYVGLPFQKT